MKQTHINSIGYLEKLAILLDLARQTKEKVYLLATSKNNVGKILNKHFMGKVNYDDRNYIVMIGDLDNIEKKLFLNGGEYGITEYIPKTGVGNTIHKSKTALKKAIKENKIIHTYSESDKIENIINNWLYN